MHYWTMTIAESKMDESVDILATTCVVPTALALKLRSIAATVPVSLTMTTDVSRILQVTTRSTADPSAQRIPEAQG